LAGLIDKVLSYNMGTLHALKLALRYFNYMYEVRSIFMFYESRVEFPQDFLSLVKLTTAKDGIG
jgi:hypothetical protein